MLWCQCNALILLTKIACFCFPTQFTRHTLWHQTREVGKGEEAHNLECTPLDGIMDWEWYLHQAHISLRSYTKGVKTHSLDGLPTEFLDCPSPLLNTTRDMLWLGPEGVPRAGDAMCHLPGSPNNIQSDVLRLGTVCPNPGLGARGGPQWASMWPTARPLHLTLERPCNPLDMWLCM